MLDLGMAELFVIGALALIVVGPKELPGLLRTLGQFTAKMRGMAREFQRSMEDAAKEADLDGVVKAAKSGGNLNKLPFDNQVVDSLKEFEKSVKSEVNEAQASYSAPDKASDSVAGNAAGTTTPKVAEPTIAKPVAAADAPAAAATPTPAPTPAPTSKPSPSPAAASTPTLAPAPATASSSSAKGAEAASGGDEKPSV